MRRKSNSEKSKDRNYRMLSYVDGRGRVFIRWVRRWAVDRSLDRQFQKKS